MIERLSDNDRLWLAHKIQLYREDLVKSPRWSRRIELAIDDLLWAASVDGVEGELIGQDAWIRSGKRLKEEHFHRVPHTAAALDAFAQRAYTKIKREHVVPRAVLRKIVLETADVSFTKRVLEEYALVTLVTDSESLRLKKQDMPPGWDSGVDWKRPQQLPDAWARYRLLTPPIVPRHSDGTPAFI